MLNKAGIAQLQSIVRDASVSVETRREAFLQLQQEEAVVMEADFQEYDVESIVSLGTVKEDAVKDRLFRQITERLQPGQQNENHSQPSLRRLPVKAMRIAAGIAAFFLMAIALFVFFRKGILSGEKTDLLAGNKDSVATTAASDTLFNTSKHVQTFLLPDGSRVALAPASYVYYSKNFAVSNKIVHLQGEGRFTVHKNESMPFSVYVNDMEVRDLGTVFHIKCNGNKLNVLLVKGKVLIHSLKPSVVMPDIALEPGQQLDVNTLSGAFSLKMQKLHANPVKDTASPDFNEMLLTKVLAFDNAPIVEVLQALQNEFHVTLRMSNGIKEGLLFTGQFTEYMSLSQILNIISRSYNLEINVQGTSILFKSNSK